MLQQYIFRRDYLAKLEINLSALNENVGREKLSLKQAWFEFVIVRRFQAEVYVPDLVPVFHFTLCFFTSTDSPCAAEEIVNRGKYPIRKRAQRNWKGFVPEKNLE